MRTCDNNTIDKYDLQYGDFSILKNYFLQIAKDKIDFNSNFSRLLHKAETLLFKKALELSEEVSEIQKFINNICFKYEYYNPNRQLNLKIAITTTNMIGAVERLVATVVKELEKSKWNYENKNKLIEFLIIENSSEQSIINDNSTFCENFNNNTVKLNYIGWNDKIKIPKHTRPYDIGTSRILLIERIKLLGWKASKEHPIWILDDDFEFTITIPDNNFNIKRTRLGSIFHRLECIAKERNYDAIVGGNTSSPPLPELSTMRLQLLDLKEMISPKQLRLSWKEIVERSNKFPDYYYDLSRENISYFPITKEHPESEKLIDFVSTFLDNLICGIPATRYLFAPINVSDTIDSAWILNSKIPVSGGNTVYFNSDLFNSNDYWKIKYGKYYSRRADSIWFLLNKNKGYNIGKVNLPLTHARNKRINQLKVSSLISNSVNDALGVALWEIINKYMYYNIEEVDNVLLLNFINMRLEKIGKNLSEIHIVLHDIAKDFPEIKELNSYKTLIEVSELKNRINFHIDKVEQIELVKYE